MRAFVRSGLDALARASRAISSQRTEASSRSLHLAALSTTGNAAIGIVKVLLGLLALSAFACVNGLYTIALVAARACALSGSVRDDKAKVTRRCLWAAWLLLLASLLYLAYSGWAFVHPASFGFGKYMAITIAAVTFFEIGSNIYGLAATKGGDDLPLHVIRAIGLATSLVSLVLTQTALLSIGGTGSHDLSSSALLGLLVGSAAAAIAIFEIVKCRQTAHDLGMHVLG
jgi:hypothetical protein